VLELDSLVGPDLMGRYLSERGVAWHHIKTYEPHEPVDLDAYDLVIGLGGAMNADETDRYPHLLEARELFAEAVRRDVPLLAICLSGQILARALGAQVTRMADPELGLVELTIEAPDPLIEGLESVHAIHLHEDAFSVPEGGTIVASSPVCATQIVRCADRAYAIQFHPEISAETFTKWMDKAYTRLSRDPDPANQLPYIDRVQANHSNIRRDAERLFDNFLRMATDTSCRR
jgi:GMP synthase-like glutamine amidotransferase